MCHDGLRRPGRRGVTGLNPGAIGPTALGDPVIVVADLGYLVLGILFLALGLITLLLTILRSASRDTSVFLFGAMSCLWGVRFLLYTGLVPALADIDPAALGRVARVCTYFGAAAVFGFACTYLGPGWRRTLRWLAVFSLVFALAASLAMLVRPDRDLLLPVFNVMVVVGAGLVIANVVHLRARGGSRHQGLVLGISIAVFFFVLENLRALGFVPLPFASEWAGVLVLYLTLGRLIAVRLFTNERSLAALNHELATARRIQLSLLPTQAPRVPGITFAARYVPMSQVAGDIYDFVAVDDNRLTILLADVSGHGVPAALIASMVKGAFRAQSEVMDRPERVLAGMNRILAGEFDTEFVTAVCAVIDTQRNVLRCAGAGHPPLLMSDGPGLPFRATGSNGLMLGPFPEAVYTGTERPLTPGARLVLYTDGVTEAENTAREQYGDHELQRALAGGRGLPADAMADALVAAVGRWTGRNRDDSLEDDLTLIVVDVGAGGA